MSNHQVESVKAERQEGRQFVSFVLAQQEFAFDIESVNEIIRVPRIARLPRAPRGVVGIINLRGSILSVLDARLRLGLPEAEDTEQSRIVIVGRGRNRAGLKVDEVRQVVRSKAREVEPFHLGGQGDGSCFGQAILKLEGGSRMLTVLDAGEFSRDAAPASAPPEVDSSVGQSPASVSEPEADSELRRLIVFRCGETAFAVPIDRVREIVRFSEPSPVPGTPDYVLGLLMMREQVFPILDLSLCVGDTGGTREKGERFVVVVEEGGTTAGLVVDRVQEVIGVRERDVEKLPDLWRAGSRAITGIVRLDQAGRLAMLLDPSSLLADPALPHPISEGRKTGDALTEARMESAEAEGGKYVTFRLDNEECGIPIGEIEKIDRVGAITRIPNSPDYVQGIANLRGEVMPVVNARKLLGLASCELNDRARLLILQLGKTRSALLVDEVRELVRIPNHAISQSSLAGAVALDEGCLSGVAALNKGERLVLLLDVARMAEKVMQGAGQAGKAA